MIDLEAEPGPDGRHPKYKHLAWFDFESHYGSYLVTSPALPQADALWSADDLIHALDADETIDGAYLVDDYLDSLEPTPAGGSDG